jgi:hypothetical protein
MGWADAIPAAMMNQHLLMRFGSLFSDECSLLFFALTLHAADGGG